MLERLEELAKNDPFIPYKVIMSNGSEYPVYAPLMIAEGKTEIAYFFPKSDRLAHLRKTELVSIETIELGHERNKR